MSKCANCGRSFTAEALARHERICEKVFGSKRKVFNTVNARLEGTGAEGAVRSGGGVRSKGGSGKVGRVGSIGGSGGGGGSW